MTERITITSEIDKRRPDVCRFTVENTLFIGTKTIKSKGDTNGFPLGEKLFEVDGVSEIQLIGRLLVVKKSKEGDWTAITKGVRGVLTAYFVSGLALTKDQVEERMMLIGRDAREKIEYLLQHQINPGVAEHGGFVQLVDLKDNVVYLRMGGGCQGCSAADFTLRQSIESIICREVPEIKAIRDITDHAAGTRPYYQQHVN